LVVLFDIGVAMIEWWRRFFLGCPSDLCKYMKTACSSVCAFAYLYRAYRAARTGKHIPAAVASSVFQQAEGYW
jgi:hypothetical protein